MWKVHLCTISHFKNKNLTPVVKKIYIPVFQKQDIHVPPMPFMVVAALHSTADTTECTWVNYTTTECGIANAKGTQRCQKVLSMQQHTDKVFFRLPTASRTQRYHMFTSPSGNSTIGAGQIRQYLQHDSLLPNHSCTGKFYKKSNSPWLPSLAAPNVKAYRRSSLWKGSKVDRVSEDILNMFCGPMAWAPTRLLSFSNSLVAVSCPSLQWSFSSFIPSSP